MKKIYFFMAVLLSCNINLNAQFSEGFESCSFDGQIVNTSPWLDGGCGGNPDCGIQCSTEQAHSGMWSGLISNDEITDSTLDLGNRIFGFWAISFWMYVPSEREAYWNILNEVSTGGPIMGGFFFNKNLENPGVGVLEDSVLGDVNFNFPHDEWFRVVMNFDFYLGASASAWNMCVDGEEIIPVGTPFSNNEGIYAQSLGGINFFSISNNNYYFLDDFFYDSQGISCILNVEENKTIEFSILPNPSENLININSEISISEVKIYSINGKLLKTSLSSEQIDISNLSTGIYFVEAISEQGKSVQKLIKN